MAFDLYLIYNFYMFKRYFIVLAALFLLARPASAHLLSYSVFDFEPTDDGLVLVVGIQPQLALNVMGFSHDSLESVDQFKESLPLIEAFVLSAIRLEQNGEECNWDASIDPLREDLIEQQAEGITLRGNIRCPQPDAPFTIETDLFMEAHESQKNLIRYHHEDIYEVIAELDETARSAIVDPSSFYEKSESMEPVAANDLSSAGEYAPPLPFILLLAFIVGIGFVLWIRRDNNGK